MDIALHQAMGADDDIDAAVGQTLQHLALLGLAAQAGEHFDAHRERRQPLAEGREVLQGQHGGRHQHRHLTPVVDRLERRPQRDLGLAEADIADDEAVHRLGRLQIAGHRLDGRVLIRGFHVGK